MTIAMSDIEVLAPIVTTHLKGAPDEVVLIYLRRAAKQFCKDSSIWEMALGTKAVIAPVLPEVTLVYTVPDDDFVLPPLSALKAISEIRFGETANDLITEDPDPRLTRDYYRYDVVTKELRISGGAWDTAGFLTVRAVLTTALTASEIPEFLVEHWSEAITNYAVWEMMNMPEREWSNSRESKTYLSKYHSRVNEARVERAREGTTGRIQVDPLPFN